VIPDVKIAWRDLIVGSLITAALFTFGIIGLGLYFRLGDLTSSYGVAGSFMVLLIWIYYSAQILFLGAEFTQVFARRYGQYIRPADDEHWDAEGRLEKIKIEYSDRKA
jgi:membrane protein